MLIAASTLLPLSEWETFYVILGSSAAALTGLMFVVMALMAGTSVVQGSSETMSAFATPNIVHFSVVLLLAATLTMPHHTAGPLAAAVLAIGLAGLAYAIVVTLTARRQDRYTPELEDWIFHIVLPIAAYAALLVAGILLNWHPSAALYIIALSALLLLYIGIHNAWDAAVWTVQKRDVPPE
jgi:hypothetical protein